MKTRCSLSATRSSNYYLLCDTAIWQINKLSLPIVVRAAPRPRRPFILFVYYYRKWDQTLR